MPRSTWLSREAAVALANARVENAQRIALLPPLDRGMRYASDLRGDSWPVKARHVNADAFAYSDGAMWHAVDSASGVALASFKQRTAAATLVDAVGAHITSYFDRAASGDVRAATAIGRLCRIHRSRNRRT